MGPDLKDIIKALNHLSKKDIGALSALNNDTAKRISDVLKESNSYNRIENATRELSASTSRYQMLPISVSDTLKDAIADFSVRNLSIISTSIRTPLLESIQNILIHGDYEGYIKILQDMANQASINAVDFSFLRRSDNLNELFSNVQFPNEMKVSLNSLNVFTAERLSQYSTISYNSKLSCFVLESDKSVSANMNEMNVICSGSHIFESIYNDSLKVSCNDEDDLVTEPELMEFMTLLAKEPHNSGHSSIGKRINNLVVKVAPRINFDYATYYHSRAKESKKAFKAEDMLSAPYGVTRCGRYNMAGQGYYYFSNKSNGAIQEVKKHSPKAKIQTAELKPVDSVSMVDLSQSLRNGKTFLRYIRLNADTTKNAPREYLIPQFVATCCIAAKLDGIKYYGSKEYYNYVCWDANHFIVKRML